MWNRVVIAAAMTLAVASGAAAQTTGGQPSQPPATGSQAASAGSTTSTEMQTRPATTTFMGDTGLWNVPTGEVLPARKWSLSAYRVNFDDNQGFTDVSNWPVTFGIGIKDRAEIFGSFSVVTRVDRDIRPLFVPTMSQAGGVVPQNPLMNDDWSGNVLGDLWIGAKINLASQWRQKPLAFAIRPMIKLPTAKASEGAGTGKAD